MQPAGHRFAHILLVLALLISASACVNLDAVGEFAALSAETADYEVLVSEYEAAPIARLKYSPRGAPGEPDEVAARNEAAVREKQRVRLLAVQGIVVEYMSAIGALADNDLARADAEIASLRDAATGSPFFKPDESEAIAETGNAAAKIATLLTNAILDGYRQRKLKKLIGDANDPLQEVLRGLQEIARQDFQLTVEQDEHAIKMFFQGAGAEATASESDQLARVVKLIADERLADSKERKPRIEAYASALQKIAEGHTALAKSEKLDDDALKDQLKRAAKDLKKLIKAVRGLAG